MTDYNNKNFKAIYSRQSSKLSFTAGLMEKIWGPQEFHTSLSLKTVHPGSVPHPGDTWGIDAEYVGLLFRKPREPQESHEPRCQQGTVLMAGRNLGSPLGLECKMNIGCLVKFQF